MKHLLFVCSQNKLRSPTGEAVFCDMPNIETRSAGLNNKSEVPLGVEDIEWADYIFVMEKTHKSKVQSQFRDSLKHQKLICLNIPDNYEYMQPELVALFKKKLAPILV